MAAQFFNMIDRMLGSRIRGAARIRAFIKGRWPAHLIRAKIDDGLLLDLDVDNYIERSCIANGFYEPEVLKSLSDSIRDDDVIWDIGANIGLMSIALKKKHPKATVLAFECSPLTLHRLAHHAALNRVDIAIHSAALSSANGLAKFHVKIAGNHGVSSLQPWVGETYESAISLSTVTAAWLIDCGKLPAPNVVKLDVEGHEPSVLEGFEAHLGAANLRAIVFEAADRDALSRVSALLDRFGFSIAPISPTAAVPTSNFIARRTGK